jgi:hypothetical protein
MTDIRNPTVIWIKGLLFLLIGLLASALLLLNSPHLSVAVLLMLAVWSFCRFYYFAFYVIEHYVDAEYRFAGLLDFARYAWRKRVSGRRRGGSEAGQDRREN